jgi:large subunit ribosomal protein L29
MKASEIRQMKTQEIKERIDQDTEHLVTLRFQHASSQLTDTSLLTKARRDIARMQTVLKQRATSGEDQ